MIAINIDIWLTINYQLLPLTINYDATDIC